MKYPLRTRFAGDILCEFLPPKKPSNNVVILAPGLPSGPTRSHMLRFFAARNYWVFLPRYRGCWESFGSMLAVSPEQDIADIIDGLYQPITTFGHAPQTFDIQPEKIILIGGSFGGPAVLLNSHDPRVHPVVAISPVIDWNVESPDEPRSEFAQFVRNAFGDAYRAENGALEKLGVDAFYNPIDHIDRIDGSKVLIFHAHDDRVTPFEPVKKFVSQTHAQLRDYPTGGHLSLSLAMKFWPWRMIKKLIR
jgi:pimeloyl-ACP methyl ester carboxylesterase